jgi:LPS-assembly protein
LAGVYYIEFTGRGIMPYRTRILEVTPLCRATHRASPALPLQMLCLATLLSSLPCLLHAQTPELLQASDIDWVSLDELSEAQRALLPTACCGLYLEPAFVVHDEAPGSTVIDGSQLELSADGLIVVSGGIQVLQEAAQVSAGKGSYDQNRNVLLLQDDIRIRKPGMLLTANSARLDEMAARSELETASYVLHESGIRGTARVIIYTDADGIITINNGEFTRCEPGDNSWSIAGNRIQLDQAAGRGTARSVTLQVRDVPVFYLPWVSFPINDERVSGLLAPTIGNTRHGGLDIAAPYYLNLAPHYDMTLTPRMQTERGALLGVEGRYQGKAHQQVLEMHYLPNDKLYDPVGSTIPGSNSPPVPDRWHLSYELQGRLAPGWSASVDYEAVSDTHYFQDLSSNGLLTTAQSFLPRTARINYRGSNWNFSARTQAFQIIDPSVSALAEPYRLLPALNLRGDFANAWGLEYGIDSEFVMFERNLDRTWFTQAQIDAGAMVKGSRLSLTPSVSLPWSNSFAFARPTLKYHYTSWDLDNQALGTNGSPTRGIASTSMDSGLFFDRDIKLFGEGMRQTLEPRLFYLYNEYQDQSGIPLFDSSSLTFSFSQLFRDDRFSGRDRIGDTNQLTMAMTSRLYDDDGQERARASIGQIHYLADRRVTLLGPPGVPDSTASSALVGEFSLQLGKDWRAGTYFEWDTTSSALEVANFQFQYQSDINHILNFGYRYREVPGPELSNGVKRRIDQTDVSGIWPLTDNWGLIGRWNFDIANNRNLESIAGVEYNNCCWTVRVLARQWIDNNALFMGVKDDNRGVFVQFELKGLGSLLGGNVSGILNNGIMGYRERDQMQAGFR